MTTDGVSEQKLIDDVHLLTESLDVVIRERAGEEALRQIRGVRERARELREGGSPQEREAFAAMISALPVSTLERLARAFTLHFLLINSAEEQHRVRVLRSRDQRGLPPDGSLRAAVAHLKEQGISPHEVRGLLERLLVMPVLTAHPSEARRRTVLDHLADISFGLDRLDDPRVGLHQRARIVESIRAAILALATTSETRPHRPTPLDEVSAGIHVFDRTLMDATPEVSRELEAALAESWPKEFPEGPFQVGPFLRWGSWIGGDRDGNPNITAQVTRATFERHRAAALDHLVGDVRWLGRRLSVGTQLTGPTPELLAEAIDRDEDRFPQVTARERKRRDFEPWREKLALMEARLEATRARSPLGYTEIAEYLADLQVLQTTLEERGLGRLARDWLYAPILRARAFGFHLATLDIRQHSDVHARAVDELLSRGGRGGYAAMDEQERVQLLASLLERADVPAFRDRSSLSPETRELLATMEVVGRARRELGPEACERWIVSFCRSNSDLLEVLFLARTARLAPDELRPVPLLEQLEDLENGEKLVDAAMQIGPLRTAMRGELEVMVGYSDSGKQVGYTSSSLALHDAQVGIARAADRAGVMLTVFHGRGGAVGRGGGPASRTIRAQPREALRGRFRVTEQGETIATRYGRLDVAERDLEQMVSAVLLGSLLPSPRPADGWGEALQRAADASRREYQKLVSEPERLIRYVQSATPIQHIAEMRIASRPASRGKQGMVLEDLRAIPWVFSWNQSRHGIPGWFGLGTALETLANEASSHGSARELYQRWPWFRALIDNAQLALARADIDIAGEYAKLAGSDGHPIFELIRQEYQRTVTRVLDVANAPELLAEWPTIAETVRRRNPYVDVLSHIQIALLGRIRTAADEAERERIQAALFVTINGIAAGLQTAG